MILRWRSGRCEERGLAQLLVVILIVVVVVVVVVAGESGMSQRQRTRFCRQRETCCDLGHLARHLWCSDIPAFALGCGEVNRSKEWSSKQALSNNERARRFTSRWK